MRIGGEIGENFHVYGIPMLHCSPVSYLPSYNILFCFFQNLVCSLHNSLDDGFHASERLDKTFIQKEFPHLHPMFPPPESYTFSHKHDLVVCISIIFKWAILPLW